MIQIRKAASLFAVAVALAASSAASSAADPPAEVAAVLAVDQAWLKAYNSGDIDALAALYDERAVLLPPGAPAVSGRAAIHVFFAQDVAAMSKDGLAFSLGPRPDGGASGDLGWTSGTYAVKDKSGRVVDTGKYLSVFRRKNGKWLYVRDTWNSDAAAEPPAPPKK